jgi:hypothetical protein
MGAEWNDVVDDQAPIVMDRFLGEEERCAAEKHAAENHGRQLRVISRYMDTCRVGPWFSTL